MGCVLQLGPLFRPQRGASVIRQQVLLAPAADPALADPASASIRGGGLLAGLVMLGWWFASEALSHKTLEKRTSQEVPQRIGQKYRSE